VQVKVDRSAAGAGSGIGVEGAGGSEIEGGDRTAVLVVVAEGVVPGGVAAGVTIAGDPGGSLRR
jgi:hypothetical protein